MMGYEEYLRMLEEYDQSLSALDSKIKILDKSCDIIELKEERLEEEYKNLCEQRDFIEKAKKDAKLFSLRDMPFWQVIATCVLLLANPLDFLPLRIFTIVVLGTSVLTKAIEYANGKYILKKFAPLVKELEEGKVEKNIDKQQELEKLFTKTESQKSDLTEKKLKLLQAKSDFQNSYIKSVVPTLTKTQTDDTYSDQAKKLVRKRVRQRD